METLTILPTAVAAGDWTISNARDRGGFGFRAISRSQFIRLAQTSVHPCRAWFTEGESLAVAAGVLGDYYAQRPSAPFSGLKHRLGFWRSLHRFLNECRRACIGRAELSAILRNGNVRADRSDFLGDLYDAYETRLLNLNAVDAACAENGLAEDLKTSFDRIPFLADVDEIHIRGIYDIKPATFEWILELSRHRPTTVFLPLPKDHPRSIRWLEWTYRKFEYLGDESPTGLTVQSEDLQTDRALSALLPRLFMPVAQLKEQKLPLLDPDRLGGGATRALRILAAENPRKEIMEIARQARALLESGVPARPQRIAVLFRRPGNYPNALDAFAAFGVPVEVSPELGAEWDPEPLTREALDFADLSAKGFKREDLIGWIGRTACAILAPLRNPDLGRILREARVMHGNEKNLDRKMEAYTATIRTPRRRREATEICGALRDFLSGMDSLGKSSTPARYVSNLYDRLKSIGLFDSAVSENSMDLEKKMYRLNAILKDWGEDLEPNVLNDLISATLSADGTAGPKHGVRMLSIDDMAAIGVDHLFVAGLTTGAFPQEPKQEVFLKDHERREVSMAYSKSHRDKWGPKLAGHRPFDTAQEERLHENFLFFLCLAQPSQGTTLSYAKTDTQGRPVTTSPYIDEIQKQFNNPEKLFIAEGVGPKTCQELEMDAILALNSGSDSITVADPERIRRIAEHVDIERGREKFYLERDRRKRATLAFEYTGRLSIPGPFWKGEEMSAGSLETFAGCPFKGFARVIVGIREVDRPVEGLSAKDLGTFLHQFLEILWRELKRRFDHIPKDPDDIMDAARRIVPKALEDASREMSGRGAAGALWESQKGSIRHLVESILDNEKKGLTEGYWPKMIEEPISWEMGGPPGVFPRRVSGRIDRLDLSADGKARVIDYKLSDESVLRDKKKKMGATELQLPLYANAAIPGTMPLDAQVDLLYVSLRHSAKHVKVWNGTKEELAGLLNLGPIVDLISSGRFDVTPEDETLCKRCDFRRACRIREVLSAEDES